MRDSMKSVAIAVAVLISGRALAEGEPTKAELRDFGRAMQAAITAGDVDAYVAMWDDAALLDRVTANIEAPAAARKGFRDAMIAGGVSRKIAGPLVEAVRKQGNFSFISVKQVDGELRPILRLVSEGGFNYHEMIVRRDAAGKLRAVDVYIYAIGETMGALQRRIYLQMMASGKEAPPAILLLQRMQEAIKANDFKGAIAEFDKADPEVRKEKMVQFTRLSAALKAADDEAYRAAAADYSALFGDDAAGNLMSLDPLFHAKRYDEYLGAIERIDRRAGGDPYLDFQRGRIAQEKGETAQAKQLFESALKRDPTLFEPADTLLSDAIEAKDYPTAKKYLLHIERNRPEFRFGDLKGVEPFAGFVASPQYAEWQTERPKATK